ncbi:hypothetical protein C6499_04180 [Candidatus Poribacteria bacterium]|nr:MAG: hypothetical protein C6499_04180 [Candidatus Poribacteria bacterium]
MNVHKDHNLFNDSRLRLILNNRIKDNRIKDSRIKDNKDQNRLKANLVIILKTLLKIQRKSNSTSHFKR